MNKRAFGSEAETVAASYLETKNLMIVGRNMQFWCGEIDILALDFHTFVVVEVKAKTTKVYGSAAEMITKRKQKTLLQLAKLIESKYNKPVRVDVVAIDGFATPHQVLTHYPGAIEV